MNARIFFGGFLSVIGVPSVGLGLLFFVASKSDPSRVGPGTAFVVCGIIFLIPGIYLFVRGLAMRPAGIRSRILKLARRRNGEITEEQVAGELGTSDAVTAELNIMLRSGLAKEVVKEGRRLFVFQDFQHHLAMKACPYCGNDYPVREDIEQCPSCGGDLKLEKKGVTSGEEPFYMDS